MDSESSLIEEESSFEILSFMEEDSFYESIQSDLNEDSQFLADAMNKILAERHKSLFTDSVSRLSDIVQPSCSCFNLSASNSSLCATRKNANQSDSQFCPKRLSNISLEGLAIFPASIAIDTQDSRTQVNLEDKSDLSMNQQIVALPIEHTDSVALQSISQTNSYNDKDITIPKPVAAYESFKYVSIERSYPRRDVSICQLGDISLSLCKWFQTNNFVRRFIEGAKASAKMIREVLEEELFGLMDNSLMSLKIISEKSHFLPIRNGFIDVFDSNFTAKSVEVHDEFAPVLPVGFGAALGVADAKIRSAKENYLVQQDDVVVSIVTFIFQAVPQRWQLASALCLNDLKSDLVLHNFTVTTPVPNEYVQAAKIQTPLDYMNINYGFSVTLPQALGDAYDSKAQNFQEFLCGYESYRSLRSAAIVLAGMYKRYVGKAD